MSVRIHQPQIVNGCQTTTVISKAGKLDDVYLLTRVIKESDGNIIKRIIEATNKQSSVCDRDFRSKDNLHKPIFEFFSYRGLFYDYRRGTWDRALERLPTGTQRA